MKADSWPGLVTNASPFSVPLGAAVEQTNLESRIPGQLTARSGMRLVATTSASSAILDCYPYAVDGSTYLVAMTSTGELVALASPAYGPTTAEPATAALSSTSGSVQSSYTFDYANAEAPEFTGPTPPPVTLLPSLNGGLSGGSRPYYVDANLLCSGGGKQDVFDGGTASDDTPEPTIPLSAMCAT